MGDTHRFTEGHDDSGHAQFGSQGTGEAISEEITAAFAAVDERVGFNLVGLQGP